MVQPVTMVVPLPAASHAEQLPGQSHLATVDVFALSRMEFLNCVVSQSLTPHVVVNVL